MVYMKIAFVHDWIVHEWGAEAVLKQLIQNTNYSTATLFVLYSTQKEFVIKSNTTNLQASDTATTVHVPIITALPKRINSIFLFFSNHQVPVLSKLFDYRNLMFWFPALCYILRRKIQYYNPDAITIDSFAAVKNIIPPFSITKPANKKYMKSKDWWANHIKGTYTKQPHTTLYLHSPMQYIRENYSENISKLWFPIKQLYIFATKYLRPWDQSQRQYDVVLYNSNYTAKLAKQLYKIDWQVSYPQIDKAFEKEPIIEYPKEYYVFIWRVQRYVREIDRVITLCNKTNTPLIVIGNGPDMEYAKSIAGPTILFVGNITDVWEKITLIKHSCGLINLAKESFGIATVEALCLGIPVFGYNEGATPELVSSENWYLVNNKDTNTLIKQFQEFKKTDFDRLAIAKNARKKFFS